MGDHEHRSPVFRQRLLQSNLGIAVQVAGGFVQQQGIVVAAADFFQLGHVPLAAGQLQRVVGFGNLPEIAHLIAVFFFRKHAVNVPQDAGFAGAVGAHDSDFVPLVHGKGDVPQQFVFVGEGIVLHGKSNSVFRGDVREGEGMIRNLQERILAPQGLHPLHQFLAGLQLLALLRVGGEFRALPEAVHQLLLGFDVIVEILGHFKNIDSGLQQPAAVFRVGAGVFLELHVLDVKDFVEALTEKQAAVGDGENGSVVAVDQMHQPNQVLEIQEYIRLVHDQELRLQQHIPDDVQQFVFAAADGTHGILFDGGKSGGVKLLSDVGLVIVSVHCVDAVHQDLKFFIQLVRILRFAHLLSQGVGFPQQVHKWFCQKIKDGGIAGFVFHKLPHVAGAEIAAAANQAFVGVFFLVHQQVYQGAFAAAVASDEHGVFSRLDGKGNIFV